MTTEEKISRSKELKELEKDLKNKRDFEGLIKIHDESMRLFGNAGNFMERMPQKVYCLARLGRKQEAKEAFAEIQKFAFFLDENKLYRIITLLTFFIDTKAEDFQPFQLNTIKGWLNDPIASSEVKQIVFDAPDIIGNTIDANLIQELADAIGNVITEEVNLIKNLDKETLKYIYECDIKMDERITEEMVLQTIKDIAMESDAVIKQRAMKLWRPFVSQELAADQKHELEFCTLMRYRDYVSAIMEDFEPQIQAYKETIQSLSSK
jgi:hypothetical protein